MVNLAGAIIKVQIIKLNHGILSYDLDHNKHLPHQISTNAKDFNPVELIDQKVRKHESPLNVKDSKEKTARKEIIQRIYSKYLGNITLSYLS